MRPYRVATDRLGSERIPGCAWSKALGLTGYRSKDSSTPVEGSERSRGARRNRRASLVSCLGAAATLLFAGPALAREDLSPHAFQKLVERTRGAIVPVVSKPRGMAVIIGVEGHLLAPADLVRDHALTVEIDGRKLEAQLAQRDEALGVALLTLEPGAYPAAVAGSASSLEKGRFLLGLSLDKKGKLATAHGHFKQLGKTRAGLPTLHTNVPCGSGAALFNSRGELVGIRVARKRTTFALEEIRTRLVGKAAQ